MDYLKEYVKFCFDCNYKNIVEHAVFKTATVKIVNKHITIACDKLELHHMRPKSCGGNNVFGYNLLVLTAAEHRIAHDLLSKAIIQRRIVKKQGKYYWKDKLTIADNANSRRLYCCQAFDHTVSFRSYFSQSMDKLHVRRIIAGIVH